MVKKLNKKKSIDFLDLTVGGTIHRSPIDIVNHLVHHFTERHEPPSLNINNQLDIDAYSLWNLFSSANLEDIQLVTSHADLLFNKQDIKCTIRSMKNKNSSGLDRVSNRMVKLLPSQYHELLASAYSVLFRSAFWESEWKRARTICLNKCDQPAPSTNQLRPISMLPTFSKIYERLFLLRFNSWTTRMNILPSQQSGARPHQATTSRVNYLLEQITQTQRYCRFIPVIYIDFMQAFDKLWHQGLIWKLRNLDCPSSYLIWPANYFSNRTMKIDYNGLKSTPVNVERGAPQESCLGPVMYVICHYDLPLIFQDLTPVHAYVDDIAIAYPPSIYLNYRQQTIEIEKQINKDMMMMLKYTKDWRQPLNPNKTEMVVYHKSRQCPRLHVYYDGIKIVQKDNFKYLGFHIDSKLTFRCLIDAQFNKLRKAYVILKYIHRQFPSFNQLKMKFFNTYIWPHLYMMASIFCLLSPSSRERLAAFHRRCTRPIHQLYQCPTKDLHGIFKLPTIEERFKKSLAKRMKNIQVYEPSLIECVLLYKHSMNILYEHYRVKVCIKHKGEKADFCTFEVQRSTEKYEEVQRSTKKYEEVPRSTKKYREVRRSTKKYREVSRSTEK